MQFNKLKKLTDLEAAGLFYNNIGCRFLLQKDYGYAEFILCFAEQLYPDSPMIKNNLGVLYLKLGEFDKALNYFLKGINLDSHSNRSLISNVIKLSFYFNDKKRDKILKTIEKKLDKNYYWHIMLAKKYMKENDFHSAFKELKKAEKLFPQSQEVVQLFLRYAKLTGNSKLYKTYLKKVKTIDLSGNLNNGKKDK